MSKLHEFKTKHKGMTKVQIENCNCELCQSKNVGMTKRKDVPKEKNVEDIAREMGIKI